ncbi:MAG TPA: phage holin family protein [Anaerolineaceae bacterium]|nr:phage holin family protein [Anaerolineaceae bacterium]
MKKFLIRLAVNAVALYVAVALLKDTYIYPQSENWASIIWLALIFGLVNAILRPIVITVGCPVIILTLGLGTLLVNTLMFWLAGQIGLRFDVGFEVEGFWGAFLGALIVSVVSFILSLIFRDARKSRD